MIAIMVNIYNLNLYMVEKRKGSRKATIMDKIFETNFSFHVK